MRPWQHYCQAEGFQDARRRTSRFWTDAATSNHLITMVAMGIKRAACGPMQCFGEGHEEPPPEVGDHTIVLDHRHRPRLIWRTSNVAAGPLCGVTDAFVWRHGVGDGSRRDWLRLVNAGMKDLARQRGVDMHDAVETLFLTFEVVWPPAAVRKAKLLAPRFDHGLELIGRLEAAQTAAENAEVVMAAVETAVMTLDADLRLRTANPAADALLRSGDRLRLRGGRLHTRWTRDQRALWSALQTALKQDGGDVAQTADGSAPRATFLPIERGEGRTPYRAGMFPLRREAAPHSGASVILIVEDPDRTTVSPETEADFLARAFGLSGAEARLAVRLASGALLPDAADATGIARSTAKTHLVRIFDKTDVRRQAELIRLLRDCRSIRLALGSGTIDRLERRGGA